MTVIVTGFEPFGGRAFNRSWQAVEAMGSPIERVRLPVEFAPLATLVPALVARKPRALLLVGEAARPRLTLERIARNACDASKVDNAGTRREQVHDGGPPELAATWDIDRALAAARAHTSAAISDDAGGYCCNAALYHALHAAAPDIRIGFAHVPRARWPAAARVAKLARALDAIVETMLR